MALVIIEETKRESDIHRRGDIVVNHFLVILVTSSNNVCFSGIVLESTSIRYPKFSYVTEFEQNGFKKFNGKITLSQ